MYNERFKNRMEAGQLLAHKLKKYQDSNSIILAIPRGGVAIGYEIAQELHLPLDIVLSKKIGHPNNKEYAIGAVSLDTTILDEHLEIPREYIQTEMEKLQETMREKYAWYRGDQPPLDVENKNVIVVDDGIATGNTLLACLSMLRKKNPAKIIVAVPVLPSDTVPLFQKNTDEFVYLIASPYFRTVGGFYDQFEQVEDTDVIQMLTNNRPKE
jgi:putative phosphoribosyl transferase